MLEQWINEQALPRGIGLDCVHAPALKALDEDGHVVPLPVGFQVLTASGSVLASGQVQSGSSFSVELPGSGYYKVHARVEGESKGGKKASAEERFAVFCLLPQTSELVPQVRRVFIPGAATVADGGAVSARIGTNEGTAYAQVMVYGSGEQLLEYKELVVVDGRLEDVSFAYRKAWPDAVRLQVFYFLGGASVSYDQAYRREKSRYTLPLQFTRFHDKAYPGTQYTFALTTAPDAEVLVAAWDKSLDAVSENDWPQVSVYDSGVPEIWITPVCGVVGEEHRFRRACRQQGGCRGGLRQGGQDGRGRGRCRCSRAHRLCQRAHLPAASASFCGRDAEL